ncbi:MAG TPA: EamA family transporter, partial [Telluria sp.]|nr:EamA family transporter [Telluria sp.]
VAPRTFAAGAAAIGGVTLLFWQSIGAALRELMQGGTGHFILGVMLAVMASVASSAGSVVVSKVREQSANVMLTMAWSMLWGTIFVAIYALATGERFIVPSAPTYWGGLVYLSIFGSVIAFNAYFRLIARIGSQKAVYISVITPVISVLLSIRLENFRPGLTEWLGIAVCLASVGWVLRAPAAKPAAAPVNLTNALETP